MHKMDRVQIRPKSVERFMVSSLPLFLVIYAWFNLTCYHASRAYPLGFVIFFLSWCSISELLIDLIYVFWVHLFENNIDFCAIAKPDVCKCILEFIERRKIRVKCS